MSEIEQRIQGVEAYEDLLYKENGPAVEQSELASELANIEQARKLLELAGSPQEVKRVVDFAEALRVVMQKSGQAKEAQNEAAELGIEARRRGGEMLAEIELDKGGDAETRRRFPEETGVRLEDFGILKKTSHIWQTIAKIPEEKFRAFIAEQRAEGCELTTAAVYKYAKNLMRKGNIEDSPLRFYEAFQPDQIVDAAFDYYRETGFPYRNLPLHMCMEQINDLAEASQKDVFDSNAGYHVADTYHPHRFDGHAQGMKSPREAFEDDELLRKVLKMNMEFGGGKLGHNLITRLLIVTGTQAAANFRPGFATYMYRKFCNPGATVLDTSTGYGGRLVGFMASGVAGKYIGIDPSVQTHEGNMRMASDLGFSEAVELHNEPAEDIDPEPLRERCDFAFTSPPYFCKEVYSDEKTQSAIRYQTPERWFNGFLVPMMNLQYAALKDEAISAVNIADVKIKGDVIPLVSMAIQAAQEAGFTHEGGTQFGLRNRIGRGNETDEVSDEEVLFFRKAAVV